MPRSRLSTVLSPPVTRHPRVRSLCAPVFALATVLAAVSTVAPALGHTAEDDPALEQRIEADQPTATGPADLSSGHVDLAPRFAEGRWSFMVHDDREDPSVWRRLEDVVFVVPEAAAVPVPDDDRYDFLGVEPGTPVYVLSQTERPGVIWLGWNTQDPGVLSSIDRGVTMALLGVEGPGDLTVYLQAGLMEPPDILWRSVDPGPRSFFVELNTHAHANWLFSHPGLYLVSVEVTAELVGGGTVSDIGTLRFAVGDGVSIEQARVAPPPALQSQSERTEVSVGGAASEGDGGFPLGVAVLLSAAVLLAVLIVAIQARSTRIRRSVASTTPTVGDRDPPRGRS